MFLIAITPSTVAVIIVIIIALIVTAVIFVLIEYIAATFFHNPLPTVQDFV